MKREYKIHLFRLLRSKFAAQPQGKPVQPPPQPANPFKRPAFINIAQKLQQMRQLAQQRAVKLQNQAMPQQQSIQQPSQQFPQQPSQSQQFPLPSPQQVTPPKTANLDEEKQAIIKMWQEVYGVQSQSEQPKRRCCGKGERTI